jgi:hypothetical protein
MAMPPRERQYITNWQLSIIAAARVHNMEFIRCLRLVSQTMLPGKAPPINLEDHARQDDYSKEDKQTLVVWTKGTQGPDADPEPDEGAAGRSARPEELAPD